MPSSKLSSVSDVIDALGGTKAAASLLDVSHAAVSVWRVNNRLPAHTFTTISRELLSKALSAYLDLWKFHRKKSERRLETAE